VAKEHHGLNPQSYILNISMLIQTGPVLVATSVIPDPQVLSIKAIYDKAVVQDGHTRQDPDVDTTSA